MDLLGLRLLDDGTYGFVILEIKLGKNPELSGNVADQLQFYVDHLSKPTILESYARCYEAAYRQKRALGLVPATMPFEITISRTAPEGVIVSCGYAQRARKQIEILAAGHPGLKVIQLENDLTRHLPGA